MGNGLDGMNFRLPEYYPSAGVREHPAHVIYD